MNYGRGLTPHYVAKLLKPYGIEPRSQKMPDGKVLRGYSPRGLRTSVLDIPFVTPPQKPCFKTLLRYQARKH